MAISPAIHTSTDMYFDDLEIHPHLKDALASQNISKPFPIQAATIPDALSGRDVLGRGRTGSGKTLAFCLPLLTRLAASNAPRKPHKPRALILVPTRELANQVNEVLMPLARSLKMFTTTIYGGVGYGGQLNALRKGVDIVVACPGRLVDHMESRNIDFTNVEITVLDEADHMAELGFLQHVEQILAATPKGSQRLLFSATLDRGIDRLVDRFLVDPITHEVDSEQSPVDAMEHHVLHIDNADRLGILKNLCAAPGKTLVFTRTKHGAARLTEQLMKAGIPSVELHGNLSQSARARNLAAFSAGRADTLVATDIAARGIHVDDVSLVIHADPPEEHKAYLHRSGRTARAGAAGTVVTLMTDKQRRSVRALTKAAGIFPTTTKVTPGDDFLDELAPGERVFVETSSIDMHPAPAREPRKFDGPRNRTGGNKRRFDDRGPRRQFSDAGGRRSDNGERRNESSERRNESGDRRPSTGKPWAKKSDAKRTEGSPRRSGPSGGPGRGSAGKGGNKYRGNNKTR